VASIALPLVAPPALPIVYHTSSRCQYSYEGFPDPYQTGRRPAPGLAAKTNEGRARVASSIFSFVLLLTGGVFFSACLSLWEDVRLAPYQRGCRIDFIGLGRISFVRDVQKGFLVAFCLYLLGCRVYLAGSLRPWIVSWLVGWDFVPFFVQDVRLVPYQRDLGWLVFPWLEKEVFDTMGSLPNARSVPQTDKFYDLTKKKKNIGILLKHIM